MGQGLLIKQIVIRKKAQEIEKKSPYILLFHCSGLTSRQWRQLKNILCAFRGRTLFQPNYKGKLPHKNTKATHLSPNFFKYLINNYQNDYS